MEPFECYHVTRPRPYSPQATLDVGRIIEVGSSYNPYFKFYESARSYPVTRDTGEVIQVPAIKFLNLVRSGEVTPGNLATDALEIANHFLMLARELIFEEVRLAENQSLPSRKTCLWASDSAEQARCWASKLGGEAKILRLKVCGPRHQADANLLLGDSEPLSETYQKAALYWQGKQSDKPQLETLVSGHVTVVEVLS